MKRTSIGVTVTFVALAFLAGAPGCSESSTSPSEAPEGHTVMEGGVAHAPGLHSPFQNCTTCHGASLQGGDDGQPSCTSCHGVKW